MFWHMMNEKNNIHFKSLQEKEKVIARGRIDLAKNMQFCLAEIISIMEEDTAIIWYDSNIGEFDTSTGRKVLLDDELNSCVTLYTDLQSCVSYIESIPKGNLYFITTISCARDILPLIHQMPQIDSVFLMPICNESFEDLLINYSKIIAGFSDTKTLTESLKENIELSQKQKMAFSFYDQHKKPTRELSKESALFLWFQLFKNALINMPSDDSNAKQDLIEFLQQRYRNNNKQMKLIEVFQKTYKPDEAIQWYTGQPFLYRHVNKALRTEDIEQLYTFRFFISDLCKSLLREFQILKEYEPKVTLYRGTRISINECQKLKQNEGHIISMNGFVSTSLSKEVALSFTGTSDETNQAVLFEIECDLSQVQTIVLAQVVAFSAIKNEQEVLIDIGAVFQIISVESKENLVVIKMKATDEGNKISKSYLEINQAELKEKNVRIIWGDLLLDMGYHDKALQYFQKVQALDGTIEDWQLHIHIGHVFADKGLYKEAIEQYLYANELWGKQESTNNISILSHISALFIRKGLYDQALPILSQNLQIYETSPTIEHDQIYYHDIAFFLSRMGYCYFYKGDYDLAIIYFNRAYDIRETHYSSDHFESAEDLDQLGIIYRIKGDYKRALHYFSHATPVYERTLPSDHPKIINQLINIGLTFGEQNKNEDALKYLRKALALQQSTPSDVLMDIVFTLDIVAHISYLEGDEENSFESTQEALRIKRTYLTEDHLDIANCLTNLGNILKEQERYDEAMINYNQALTIYGNICSNGHPLAAVVLHGIGFIYQANGDYETALSHYSKAQIIYQRHFSPSNSNFIRLLLCIPEVYQLKGEYILAIESLKSCLITIQNYCSINDPVLKKTYMMLANTYILQENIVEALYAYEKGFSIEVDDDIEHYVYHVGYRLLMLSCNLESRGKFQEARNMQKNASIIFQTYDYHGLFSLIEGLFEFRVNDNNNDDDLHAKASIDAPDVIEILGKVDGLESYPPEQRYIVRRIKYYHDSMCLYQRLLMDGKQRAPAATLLACNYEKQHRYVSARYYYEKARTFYRQLMADANAIFDINEVISTINEINIRIIHLTVQSVARTFFFLWTV